jgi:chromosome partitioning protein
VLILDFDPQANASSGVGVEPREGAGERGGYLSALLDEKPLGEFIRSTRVENLSILPSSGEASNLNIIQKLIRASASGLRRQLEGAAKDFEYVIIDCPPSLRGPPTIALRVSDAVIIPVQCEYYAMEGLSQILPVVEEIKNSQNESLEVEGLLLTMFSEDLELSRDIVAEVSGYFESLTFDTVVPRDVTLAEAASHGLPAIHYDCVSKGAWSYVDLAREVMQNG